MAAWGPLKARPSLGIGFSVPLRDSTGKVCRGYVSHTVVRPLACDHYGGKQSAFPEPLDVTPGPCHVRPGP